MLHHLKNLHNVKVSGLDSLRGVGRPKLSDAAQPPEPPVEEVNKYKCAVCKMAYPIQSSVARHMRMTHGEDMDGLESDLFGYECGEFEPWTGSLTVHESTGTLRKSCT